MFATTSPDFSIAVDCAGDAWTLRPAGSLDLATGQELVALGRLLGEGQPGRVALDLSQVDFVDTAGLHAVARTCALVRAGGGSPTIAGPPSPALLRLLSAMAEAGLSTEIGAPSLRPGCQRALVQS